MVKAACRSNVEDVEAEDDVPNPHMQVCHDAGCLGARRNMMAWSPNMGRTIKTDSVIAQTMRALNDTH